MLLLFNCSFAKEIASAIVQTLALASNTCDVSFISYEGYCDHVAQTVMQESNINFAYTSSDENLVKSNEKYFQKSCTHVILVESIYLDDVKNIVLQQINAVFWNRSANIILAITRPINYNLFRFKTIFKLFQQMDMLNLLIIYFDRASQSVQKFTTTNFQSTLVKNVTKEKCFQGLFPNKERDLNGYVIKVTQYVDYPRSFIDTKGNITGTDGYLLSLLCELMNSSYLLVGPLEGTQTDSLITFVDLAQETADVGFNLRIILPSYRIMYPISILFGREVDNIVLLIPSSQHVKSYKNLIEPFSGMIWFYVALTFFTFCVSWRLFTNFQTRKGLTFGKVLFNSFRIHCLVPLTHTPNHTRERFFIMGFMLYSLTLMNGYQTILTSFLMSPRYEPNVKTIHEVSNMNLSLSVKPGYGAVIKSVTDNEFIKDHIIETNMSYWFIRNQKNRKYGFITSAQNAKFFLSTEGNMKNGEPILHMLPEILSSSVIGYYARNHLPFERKMRQYILQIIEVGLLSKFNKMSLEKYRKIQGHYKMLHVNPNDKKKAKPLRLEEISVAFIVLFVGFVVSAFALLYELLRCHILSKINVRVTITYG